MTQPSRVVESRTNGANQSEQDTQTMPALELVKPLPDPVAVNVEIAMEWALLGGD